MNLQYCAIHGLLHCNSHSILLFMNPMNFVAVILKVLLVDLLAALNFAEPKKRVWRHGRAWKMKIRGSIFTSIFMLFYINIRLS